MSNSIEELFVTDPVIFTREDNESMVFYMRPGGKKRQQVIQLIEDGGGIIQTIPSLDYRENAIHLVDSNDCILKKDEDSFFCKYIFDSVRAARLLPNLIDYRANLESVFEDYDPFDVLTGKLKWSQVAKRPIGEVVEDIQDFLDDFDFAKWRYEQKSKRFRSSRTEYTREEDEQILKYICKDKAFSRLKGNALWIAMEKDKCCNGQRTWQSMKERFRKTISKCLSKYNIRASHIDKIQRSLRGHIILNYSDNSDNESDSESLKQAENEPPSDKQNKILPPPPPPASARMSTSNASYNQICHGNERSKAVTPNKLDIDENREIEVLLNQTVIPPELIPPVDAENNFSRRKKSTIGEMDFKARNARKRRLFSDQTNYLDSEPEEDRTMMKKRTTRASHSLIRDLDACAASTQEFEAGLRRAPGHLQMNSSQEMESEVEVGLTSTQTDQLNNDDLLLSDWDSPGVQPIRKESIQDTEAHRIPISDDVPASQNLLECNGQDDIEVCREREQINSRAEDLMNSVFGNGSDYVEHCDGGRVYGETYPLSGPHFDNIPHIDQDVDDESVPNLPGILTVAPDSPRESEHDFVEESNAHEGNCESLSTRLPPNNTTDGSVNNVRVVPETPAMEMLQPQSDSSEEPGGTNGVERRSSQRSKGQRERRNEPARSNEQSTGRKYRGDQSDESQLSDESIIPRSGNESSDAGNTFQGPDGSHFNPLEVTAEKSSSLDSDSGVRTRGISMHHPKKRNWFITNPAQVPSTVVQEEQVVRRIRQSRPPISSGGQISRPTGDRPSALPPPRKVQNIIVSDLDSALECTVEIERLPSAKLGRIERGFAHSRHHLVDRRKSSRPAVNDNVELMRRGSSHRVDDGSSSSEFEEFENNHQGQSERTRKTKLKILSVQRNEGKKSRFATAGGEKFRLPYTRAEDQAIVNYFQTSGGYLIFRGVSLWKMMASSDVVPGRSWESLKARFLTHIHPNLAAFSTTAEELTAVHEEIYGKTEKKNQSVSLNSSRKSVNLYTTEEDIKIIDFICQNKRHKDIKGNGVWKLMETKKITTRSWHSMKERFCKVILKNLEQYNLPEQEILLFQQDQKNPKQKRILQ